MLSETKAYKVFKIFNYFLLAVIVFVTLTPFMNVVAQSFSSEAYINAGQVFLIPKGFNTETYEVIFGDRTFWLNYRNTILYTILGTAIAMVLTTMLSYVLSKRRLKGRGFFIGFSVFTMFFSGGMIPTYILYNNTLGITNTIWSVVLPGALSIYNMLIMKSFFENLPDSLEEAAAIDGMSTYGIIRSIILPLSKPILATMILFYAVAYWNSWFQAFLYLNNKDLFPVTLYLRNMISGAMGMSDVGQAASDNQTQIASNIKSVTMVLTVLPIITVYPFVQKYFVHGIMLGSVKE
ncbi:carbohydrate ABC transporter permease [Jeotgalibaca ciconiae]|uniref:Carbohydrate ABC transporter permease n=1 Tax=Jeotgalibaca ciconiae TaxID=2496265 RepID=A0A3S9H854_9LACT|nr:carbohydrate ABC transporter permease [Jeotgalibaca ciconiae]AZP03542.1 carbohydrate ABC transporter permease [Jeotgalibaca ciconiae]